LVLNGGELLAGFNNGVTRDRRLSMGNAQLGEKQSVISHGSGRSFLWRKLPFIAVLALAVLGVAYMNLSQEPLVGYWEVLALAMALLCVVTGWKNVEGKQAHYRLIGTQALHWLAILVTMNLVLFSNLRQMLPAPAASLVLLTLLALGTFLAGVSLLSLEIGFLGLAMAVAVPAIAWFKQSALFLLLGALVLIGLVLALWPRGEARKGP
jgi:hypothetical protein